MDNPPPDDDASTPVAEGGHDDAADSDNTGKSDANRPEDTIEPPTQPTETADSETTYRPSAAEVSTEQPETQPKPSRREASRESNYHGNELDHTEPMVDSNWWYWVAAVPIYVVAGIVAATVAGLLFLIGLAVDIGGGMGLATGAVGVVLVLGSVAYGLAGVVLSILFPIGIYFDAKEIKAAAVSWDPDPVLYLLVAAASVLLTAFTVSFVVAIYYLYRRNQAVGVP